MDYSKIDAPLAAQLKSKDPDELFPVFISVSKDIGEQEQSFLKRIGIMSSVANMRIFSATIPSQAIDELSEQPWIRYIKLSTALQLKK
jgi:hypothetical protein